VTSAIPAEGAASLTLIVNRQERALHVRPTTAARGVATSAPDCATTVPPPEGGVGTTISGSGGGAGAGRAATTPLTADSALVSPPALRAVTRHVIADPTSASVRS
jgi:hypothetical protein